MTDIFKDDETKKAHQGTNFKNRILADLKAASMERSQRLAEEERLRQERLAEAARKQEEAAAILRLAQEEAERAEREREEAERLAREAEEARRRQIEEAEEALRLAEEEAARQEAEVAKRVEEARKEAEAAEQAEAARRLAQARRQAEYEAYLAEQELLEQERLAKEALQVEQEDENLSALHLEESDFPVTETFSPQELYVLPAEEDSEEAPSFRQDGSVPIENQETEPDRSITKVPKFVFDDLDDQEDEDELVYLPPQGDETLGLEKKDQKSRLAKKISLIVASGLLFALLAGSAIGALYVSSAIKPLDKDATEFVQVEIPAGSGNRLIGQVLEEAGVIKSGTVFNYYTKFKNYTGFQSGYYNFQKSMSLDDISKLLQEGGTPEPVLPALGKIVIPEGYTLTQIAKAVTSNGATEDKSDKTPFKEADFLKVVQDPDFIASMVEKYPNLLSSLPDANVVKYQLEGYLFPATYSYYETTTVESLAEEMLAAMDTKLSPYYGQIAERGMTVNEILSMAALVEKEGSTDDDRRQIASVFYNRMAIDMPLQSNIAILYAEDKLGDKTTLAEDAAINTEIDSPYNIYTQTGLTPGPVDSPSLSAIEASIDPAKTDYLYFVADVTTGAVYYAETFEDHNANVEKYVNSHLE